MACQVRVLSTKTPGDSRGMFGAKICPNASRPESPGFVAVIGSASTLMARRKPATIPLSARLGGDHVQGSALDGGWYRGVNSIQHGSQAMWQNPGGAFAYCQTWGTIGDCIGPGPDLMFELKGTSR